MDKFFQTITDTAFQWWNLEGGPHETIHATEFWLDRQSNTVSIKHVEVEPSVREAWIRRNKNDQEHSLVARFVWVVVDKNSTTFNLTDSVHDRLQQHFKLGPAFKSLKSMASGVVTLPRVSTEESDRQAFAFSLGPQVGAIWCHNRSKTNRDEACTEAIIYTRAVSHRDEKCDDREKQFDYQKVIDNVSNWELAVFSTPVFPAYFFSLALSREIDATVADIQSSMSDTESHTGFYSFTDRDRRLEIKLEVEMLITMSQDSSGLSTRVVNESRKSIFIQELLTLMSTAAQEKENRDRQKGEKKDNAVTGSSYLNSHVASMRNRLKMQGIELSFTEKKIQIMREMILNYISQIEALDITRIGEEATNISNSTNKTAGTVYVSTWTLVILTFFVTIFLPLILVASLFSANVMGGTTFDGDSSTAEGVAATIASRWEKYKVVTATLVLIVVGIHYLCVQGVARLRLMELRGEATPGDPDTLGKALDMLEKKRQQNKIGWKPSHHRTEI